MLLGVDVGGTFTDAVLVHPGGEQFVAKVPSTPSDQAHGVLAAVALVLAEAGVDAGAVQAFSHGTTVATNALLEGRGARTALIATRGFTDLVALGRQERADLYRLCAHGPPPLAKEDMRFAADERMLPDGPLHPLECTDELLDAVAGRAPESVAVVLLHSYAHPEHERELGRLLSERMPEVHVSLSHELVGTFREYERAATTEIDAALSPLLSRYLVNLGRGALEASLPEPAVMQSSGGLADLAFAGAHAALTVLSGPAGGVGGATLVAAGAGERNALCFDMGGTSCDVCVIEDLEVRETADRRIAGRPLALPALAIHTVGAGGGSIAWRDSGGALRVGPRSAGAEPGPAAYGHGGSAATVTDANVVLGRLPADIPLASGLALDTRAALAAVTALSEQLSLDPIECAEGIVRVANAEMLAALRLLTVERGIDPRDFVLLPFGGAGPLHATDLAEQLGIDRVLCPLHSGVLSAAGLAAAAPRRDAAGAPQATSVQALHARVAEELGSDPERTRTRYELRYRGQSFELSVDAGPEASLAELRTLFELAHERRFGYTQPGEEVELITIRVSAWGAAPGLPSPGAIPGGERLSTTAWFAGTRHEVPLLIGPPAAGESLAGPAIVALGQSTLVVGAAWDAEIGPGPVVSVHRSR